jgi:putative nucleotidyltransferase with HDIG domain
MAQPLLTDLPALTTEEQLLHAVEEQEAFEWGHSGHGKGVARVALSLAESAMLPPRQVDVLVRAALLHDVGKVALASSLWSTRGVLDDADRGQMAEHVRLGAEMAAQAGLPAALVTTILQHHERWDGAGYPNGLAGEAIPLRTRIVALAESVDTMLRATYRRAPLNIDQVVSRLEADAGHRWDPILARQVVRIIRGK